MNIIILVIVFILAGFIMRGLFDSKWRANAQEKFDSIKREKKFWYLMNTEDTINDEVGETNVGGLHVRDVFRLYLFGLTRELRVGDFSRRKEVGYNNLNKNIIRQKDSSFTNINLLRDAIEKKANSLGGPLKVIKYISLKRRFRKDLTK